MCTWVYHFVSWCLTLRSSTRIPEPCNSFNHALCFAAPSLMVFWSHITNVKMSFRICKKILIWRYNTLKHRHTYRKMLNMFQTVCTLYLIIAIWNGWYCTLLLESQFSVKRTSSLFIFSLYFCIFTESPGSLTLSDQPEISDSVPPRCWNFTYGDPSEMEFFSPNFPSNYSTNLNCARYIEGKFVIYISVFGNILVSWIVFHLVCMIIAGTCSCSLDLHIYLIFFFFISKLFLSLQCSSDF